MLNRTNRTLSANSHRLNLGTRLLAHDASDNYGLTLRTAHAFPVVAVRAGVVESPGIPMEGPPIMAGLKSIKPATPTMTGPSPRSSRPAQGFWAWDQGQSVASSQPARPDSVPRDVVGSVGVGEPRVSPSQGQPRSSLAWHCDRSRLAGRSARAALALVSEAAP